MHRGVLAAGIAVFLLGGGGLVATVAFTGGDGKTLTFYSLHDDAACVFNDGGDKGEGPGDTFACVEKITDSKGKPVGGQLALDGIQISKDVVALRGTAFLPGGKVLLDGAETEAERDKAEPGNDQTPFTAAVTGGTGRYRGARGQADIVFAKTDPKAQDTNQAKITVHLD